MTESGAIKRCDMLIHGLSVNNAISEAFNDENKGYVTFEAMSIFAETCKDALEEVEQYRAIGTVEELQKMKADYAEAIIDWRQYKKIGTIECFRELTEKEEPKKYTWKKDVHGVGRMTCPNCKEHYIRNPYKHSRHKHDEEIFPYCPWCGQRLDFGEVQNERDI